MAGTTDRARFKKLAERHLEDAKALYNARRFSAAYYLAGYAAECALKAAICKRLRKHTLPPREFQKSFYVHKLATLLDLAELREDMKLEEDAATRVAANWATILNWKPDEVRYGRATRGQAQDLIRAIEEGPTSFWQWVIPRW